MQFYFKTFYTSQHGETVVVDIFDNEGTVLCQYTLSYVDASFWEGHFNILIQGSKKIFYQISITNQNVAFSTRILCSGRINIKKKYSLIQIINRSTRESKILRLYNTKPFKRVFKNSKPDKEKTAKKRATHIFNIEHPVLQDNIFMCLTGTAKKLNIFDAEIPILFPKKRKGGSSLGFNFAKEIFPIEYKIAFYDAEKKHIVAYEPGHNNILEKDSAIEQLTIVNATPDCENYLWKGAGINVPVFSLKTNNTWGSGDFCSIKNLVDYAALVGIKMIQLLPVNDTIASYSEKDSYPYSAISSFALNPLYVDVNFLLQQYNIELSHEEKEEIHKLNATSTCDFTAVVNLKLSVIKRVLDAVGTEFLNEKEWKNFYENSYEWLQPYAAFCILRDKNKTAETAIWGEYSLYNTQSILTLIHPTSKEYSSVLFWYFIQYNLHLQLKDAGKYAHQNKVFLKADLPIGIAKNSVDAWVNPELFHMDMQAGAPPDAFSTVGQNWGFPTYNIAKMRVDGFAWFIKRMKSLEHYFDALRIDHVLGLFRIWSVPQNQVDGSMGFFVPAIPLSKADFLYTGIDFDEQRFCIPFITDQILIEAFGQAVNDIKSIFFNGHSFKKEFDSQQKIEVYFHKNDKYIKYKQKLFGIVSNVILLKDPTEDDAYHFRINMQQTATYNQFPQPQKTTLDSLYNKYFFENQNELWKKEGTETLSMLAASTKMLLCAEDLGMVPAFTEQVLSELNILSLQIQQMPKTDKEVFSDTRKAKYPFVVMPATHDMAPIRLWWEQNKREAQIFYNTILNEDGSAPYFCEPWVCKKIIELHLQSPAMWSVFLLQDLMAIDGKLRRPIPAEERINDPSNPNQVWNYRMHLPIEELMEAENLNNQLKIMIKNAGR